MLILILTLTAFLSGCVSVGNQPIADHGNVAKIQEGVSTKADVRAAVGEPFIITPFAGGEAWTYGHSEGGFTPLAFVPIVRFAALASGHGTWGQSHSLLILFDNNGIVRRVEFHKTTPTTYILPFYGKMTVEYETIRSTPNSSSSVQPQTTDNPQKPYSSTLPSPKGIEPIDPDKGVDAAK